MKFLGPLAAYIASLGGCCSLNVVKEPFCLSKKIHSHFENVTKNFLIKCSCAQT